MGSEMCIRDSIPPPLPDAHPDHRVADGCAAVPGAGPGRVHARAGGERPDRHAACLLYTSDAADERSSVDLGGRRIIKNNKNMNTQQRQITQKSRQRNTTRRRV